MEEEYKPNWRGEYIIPISSSAHDPFEDEFLTEEPPPIEIREEVCDVCKRPTTRLGEDLPFIYSCSEECDVIFLLPMARGLPGMLTEEDIEANEPQEGDIMPIQDAITAAQYFAKEKNIVYYVYPIDEERWTFSRERPTDLCNVLLIDREGRVSVDLLPFSPISV